MKIKQLVNNTWSYFKIVFYSLLSVAFAGGITYALFFGSLEIKWLSYIVQFFLPMLFAAIVIRIPAMIAEDYNVELPWIHNDKVKKYLSWTSFILLSLIMIGILSYARYDSHKQSKIVMVKSATDYSVDRVMSDSPYEIMVDNKKINLLPKKDSAYVVNLSKDTLYLNKVDFEVADSKIERSWGKTRHIISVRKVSDSINKIILPSSIDCLGFTGGLDIFEEPKYRDGYHRRVLTMDKELKD